MNRLKTNFLYASSSFLAGAGTVLNLHGHFHAYNSSENPDQIALAHDWRMAAQDIWIALDSAKEEVRRKAEHERK